MLLDVLRTAYRWYAVNKAPFELLGFSLAVLGTLFAVLSIKDGQKLTKDLRTVFDHLTTREAGPFPAYMMEVDRLIADARESIFIATDLPGHGAWADRGQYGAYVKALENRKADRVRRGHPLNIQLLTLDPTGRERALQERYPESRWKDYLKRGGFQKSRRMFEELENCEISESREKFIAEIRSRQDRALDADLRFAERWEYGGLMPVYLWIIDNEKAVFAIPSFGDQLTEYGFVTQDTGLVQALLSVWSRYIESAKRVSSAPALVKAS